MQVSNVEVYYRAVSFYLEQHPDLLVDLLKVCTSGLPMPCWAPSRYQTSINWQTTTSKCTRRNFLG